MLNIKLFEEIQKIEKSKHINSNMIKKPSVLFNDLSSCYSDSKKYESEMSKDFSNSGNSWLIKKFNDSFNQKSENKEKFILNEKENFLNSAKKSSNENQSINFLIPDEDKLMAILDNRDFER